MKALEKIAALLKAEGIDILDRDAVIASLSQTCAPSYNIRVYNDAQLVGVHLRDVKPGDTVLHEGIARTVSARSLAHDGFMGYRLFGDTYRLGNQPVIVITNVRF